MTRNDDGFPVLGLLYNVVAIPYLFFIGFLVGIAAPLAAIAGVVGGIRLLTGKVPFLSQSEDVDGERMLNLRLVPPEQVGDLFAEQKDKISGDLAEFQAEIKSIIEEAQAEGAEAPLEEPPLEE
jgi:hypothetical protein